MCPTLVNALAQRHGNTGQSEAANQSSVRLELAPLQATPLLKSYTHTHTQMHELKLKLKHVTVIHSTHQNKTRHEHK